jgi:Fic family protein
MKRDLLAEPVKRRLKRLPAPFESHYGIVPLPPPEEGLDLREVSRRHHAAVGALAKVDVLAAEAHDPYFVSRILTRREAVSSSSIEGTNSTLDEMLALEETADDRSKSVARQVHDYALLLDKLLPEARRRRHNIFSLDLLRSLHAKILKGDADYKDRPGDLRKAVVWIGGANIAYSSWNPPPPEDVPACLLETVDYLRNEGMQQMNQDLITRMSVAHAHFEAVHPFRDGNGRVGRMLLPLMMAAEGRVPLYLSPYIDAHKSAYFDALKAAQQRLEWSAMVGFMSDAIVGTAEELVVTRRSLDELRQNWLTRRRFRKGSAALRSLALLPQFPIVTATRLAQMLNISAPQAMQAVSQLEEVGILKERTGYARNRVFAATDALTVINRPFGEPPAKIETPKLGEKRSG